MFFRKCIPTLIATLGTTAALASTSPPPATALQVPSPAAELKLLGVSDTDAQDILNPNTGSASLYACSRMTGSYAVPGIPLSPLMTTRAGYTRGAAVLADVHGQPQSQLAYVYKSLKLSDELKAIQASSGWFLMPAREIRLDVLPGTQQAFLDVAMTYPQMSDLNGLARETETNAALYYEAFEGVTNVRHGTTVKLSLSTDKDFGLFSRRLRGIRIANPAQYGLAKLGDKSATHTIALKSHVTAISRDAQVGQRGEAIDVDLQVASVAIVERASGRVVTELKLDDPNLVWGYPELETVRLDRQAGIVKMQDDFGYAFLETAGQVFWYQPSGKQATALEDKPQQAPAKDFIQASLQTLSSKPTSVVNPPRLFEQTCGL